ncbi:MAG: hypothetical protein AAGF11_51485 [Myxococcota bacterium]
MSSTRWLAAPLALLTGCATASASTPHLLAADLHVGALDERTAFELDAFEPEDGRDAPNTGRAPKDRVDTPKKQRRRKGLFFLGIGAAGFGALGLLGFGIGGRVVQGQISNGYADGTLTRERSDSLATTGEVMNGLTIGSAALGLAGLILAGTMYGIDHARCGELPPRRKKCPKKGEASDASPADASPSAPADASPSAPADASPSAPADASPSAPADPSAP